MRTLVAGWMTLALMMVLVGCGDEDNSYSDEMAEQHEGDTPEATAAAQAPIIPVNADTVSYAETEDGETITGYIAEPQNPDSVLDARGVNPTNNSLPGLIVIHEWWGLNDNIRAATRRLAGEGYRALAVDLFRGDTADAPEGARELMEAAMEDRAAMLANLRAANAFLRSEANALSVGILGWCFGGGMALNGALDQPEELDALVIYYGRIEDAERSELDALQMPILAHFGEEDSSIPIENVRAFEETLDELGKDAEIHTYANAGHAFSNPSGQNYQPEAAEEAWNRTTRFLQEALYPDIVDSDPAE